MDIREFAKFVSIGWAGTFSVELENYDWKITELKFDKGYQVGVNNVRLVPLQRDGDLVSVDDIFSDIVGAVSEFYYSTLNSETPRYLGVWLESEHGNTTAWIDSTVYVPDQLSANIVGAVLGEKEIYDWADSKCLTVIKAGK